MVLSRTIIYPDVTVMLADNRSALIAVRSRPRLRLAVCIFGSSLAVWCSGNALVSMNAVALHRARLVLGWVTAFGQVNCLITQPATQANSAFRPFMGK